MSSGNSIVNGDSSLTINAERNFWGTNLGSEIEALVQGNISYSPWYIDNTLTLTQNSEGSKGKSIESETSLTNSSNNNITVTIPAGTNIVSSDSSWDGTINAPTFKESPSVSPSVEGFTSTVRKVIEVGFPGVKLTFDKAVKLIIPGEAGSLVGYVDSDTGSFVEIDTLCGDNTQATNDLLPAAGDCKINDGDDLVIWTKHFTEFATYEQSTISGDASSGNSGGLCTTEWTCTEWSSCVDGIQTRTCAYPTNFCEPTSEMPAESQACELSETQSAEELSGESQQGFFATITGAVIGENAKRSLGVLVVAVLIIGAVYFTSRKVSKKNSKKK